MEILEVPIPPPRLPGPNPIGPSTTFPSSPSPFPPPNHTPHTHLGLKKKVSSLPAPIKENSSHSAPRICAPHPPSRRVSFVVVAAPTGPAWPPPSTAHRFSGPVALPILGTHSMEHEQVQRPALLTRYSRGLVGGPWGGAGWSPGRRRRNGPMDEATKTRPRVGMRLLLPPLREV